MTNAVPEFDGAGDAPAGERAREERRAGAPSEVNGGKSRRALGFSLLLAGVGSPWTLALVFLRVFRLLLRGSEPGDGWSTGRARFGLGPIQTQWADSGIARRCRPTREGPGPMGTGDSSKPPPDSNEDATGRKPKLLSSHCMPTIALASGAIQLAKRRGGGETRSGWRWWGRGSFVSCVLGRLLGQWELDKAEEEAKEGAFWGKKEE
ncbi:hypothetical protein NL676_017856 [Syzygium grande]|nr:hypothetical protein NL676_017856 [Syzygium grande]